MLASGRAKETAMRVIGLAVMVMLAGVAPLRAEPPEAKCLVPSHVWDGATPIVAIVGPLAGLPPFVMPGQTMMVQLGDAAGAHFEMPLNKPAAAGDKGGWFGLSVRTAGTYRIALQHKAWIDLVRDGKAMPSAAHAHGAPCSGIAKMVDFVLVPGSYTIQLSDTTDETIGVQVTKQP
jgi:hypothetical protein